MVSAWIQNHEQIGGHVTPGYKTFVKVRVTGITLYCSQIGKLVETTTSSFRETSFHPKTFTIRVQWLYIYYIVYIVTMGSSSPIRQTQWCWTDDATSALLSWTAEAHVAGKGRAVIRQGWRWMIAAAAPSLWSTPGEISRRFLREVRRRRLHVNAIFNEPFPLPCRRVVGSHSVPRRRAAGVFSTTGPRRCRGPLPSREPKVHFRSRPLHRLASAHADPHKVR